MGFDVTISDNAAQALDACEQFLASDPLRHNVIWTLLADRAASGAPGRYGWVTARGQVQGVSLQSPAGLRATLTPMPCPAAWSLAGGLHDAGVSLPGVTGVAPTSSRFAGRWVEHAHVGAVPTGAERMYSASAIATATPKRGSLRQAADADVAQLTNWLLASHAETGAVGTDPVAMVQATVTSGHYWVWDVDGPVSMAATTAPIGGVTRIRGVYTPQDQRGHGYASACVAAVAEQALDARVTPMLYTDLQNPVSNSVYRRIGFRALDEIVHYAFI